MIRTHCAPLAPRRDAQADDTFSSNPNVQLPIRMPNTTRGDECHLDPVGRRCPLGRSRAAGQLFRMQQKSEANSIRRDTVWPLACPSTPRCARTPTCARSSPPCKSASSLGFVHLVQWPASSAMIPTHPLAAAYLCKERARERRNECVRAEFRARG